MTNTTNETVLHLDLPGIEKLKSGKVREIFDLGEQLLFGFTNELERRNLELELFELGEGDKILIGATDRISAFDVIMPTGIPCKGRVLATLSTFWFEKTAHIIPNHLLTSDFARFPTALRSYRSLLEGRSMIVRKCEPLQIECVVRGYLAGSGWKEYNQSQSVCGINLPAGLTESAELPEPIFTPATKAETGHDENISFEQAKKIVGDEIAEQAREASLKIYNFARDYARQRGIIIADTKFEFGMFEGKLILIDEVLTPDSSRFWPADDYKPGRGQLSFDKQFVRDYLETLDWNKTPPGPKLPDDVVAKTTAKYLEAYERVTGGKL
jgi:phosphoribosylaminoimidazole-succinocarboxamide synthase